MANSPSAGGVVVAALALTFSLVLGAGHALAGEAAGFEEGRHFARLAFPVRAADPERIEVTEYFSYGCGHCFRFEPLVNRWKSGLAADVVFNRTPAIWNADYQFLAQVYYTLEIMGVLETLHLPIFRALHQDRRQILEPKAMARFLAGHGVSPEDFAEAYGSFGVKHAVQKAEARGRAYRASGVPALIVAGKYLIESGSAGSFEAMLQVADFLVAQERAERNGGEPE